MRRIDVAIFSMATRYAIQRYLTGAAETCANQVIVFAEEIKHDRGITSAILYDIQEMLRREDAPASGAREWEENRARWTRAAQALDPAFDPNAPRRVWRS